MKLWSSLLCLTGSAVILSNCAGFPGESPEHLRERLARRDARFEREQEKQRIRSESADRRYNAWWNSATGRTQPGN